MGYIIAGVLIIVVLVVVVTSFRGRPARRGQLPSSHRLERTEPAADEPTPGNSATADPDDAARAQKRVPPA